METIRTENALIDNLVRIPVNGVEMEGALVVPP